MVFTLIGFKSAASTISCQLPASTHFMGASCSTETLCKECTEQIDVILMSMMAHEKLLENQLIRSSKHLGHEKLLDHCYQNVICVHIMMCAIVFNINLVNDNNVL